MDAWNPQWSNLQRLRMGFSQRLRPFFWRITSVAVVEKTHLLNFLNHGKSGWFCSFPIFKPFASFCPSWKFWCAPKVPSKNSAHQDPSLQGSSFPSSQCQNFRVLHTWHIRSLRRTGPARDSPIRHTNTFSMKWRKKWKLSVSRHKKFN